MKIPGPLTAFFGATFRTLSLFILVALASAAVHAQQEDSTVEWKLTLKDLDQQLTGISPEEARAIAAWRFDAESLRRCSGHYSKI